jgi:hypothetical protein
MLFVVLVTHRVIVSVSMMMGIVNQHHAIGKTQKSPAVGFGQICGGKHLGG